MEDPAAVSPPPRGAPLLAGLAFLRRPRAALALVGGLALVAGGLAALDAAREVRAAPDFAVTTLAGETVRLSELRGTAVLLDLMAADCPPCRDVTAHLVALAAERGHDGSRGLRILSIDVWDEPPEALAAYANETGSGWSYALDPGAVEASYGAWAVPKLVVVDRHGLIVHESLGLGGSEALAEAVDEAVRGSAAGRVLALPAPLPLVAGGLLLVVGPATLPLASLAPGASSHAPRSQRFEVAASLGLLHLVSGLAVGAAGLAAGPWLPGGLSFLLALAAVSALAVGGALLSGLAVPGLGSTHAPATAGRGAWAGVLTGSLGVATALPFVAGLLPSGRLEALAAFGGWIAASAVLVAALALVGPRVSARVSARRTCGLLALAGGTGLLVAFFRDFGGA